MLDSVTNDLIVVEENIMSDFSKSETFGAQIECQIGWKRGFILGSFIRFKIRVGQHRLVINTCIDFLKQYIKEE